MSQSTEPGENPDPPPGAEPRPETDPAQPTEEFDFYFQFTKPLVLELSSSEDRAVAAAWVQKLETPPESDAEKRLRLDYLKLLLFVLQRGRLSGIFTKPPPTGPFQPFPPGFSMADMGNLMIDQDDLQNRGGGEGASIPYTIEISNDLREFVAAQEIPNFGVQMYYAWSSEEPIHKWTLFDEEKFPLYILDKINQLKDGTSEVKMNGAADNCGKKKNWDMPMGDKFGKKKIKTPQEIERSQARSYHTYVGLAGRMGGFEKCNDGNDQEKYPTQEVKRTKYTKTNSSTRRYPQSHPVYREAEPGMLPPEMYDNFLNYSGSKFQQPRICHCPGNQPEGESQQKTQAEQQSQQQSQTHRQMQSQQQLQQQLEQHQAQSYQDQSTRQGRPKSRHEANAQWGPAAPKSRISSPKRINYPTSSSAPQDQGCPNQIQIIPCPQKRVQSPPSTAKPSSPPRSNDFSQPTESSVKVTKQKMCGCSLATCSCMCPRSPVQGTRSGPQPSSSQGPVVEERNVNKAKGSSAPNAGGRKGGPGAGYPSNVLHCYDPMLQDPSMFQSMTRQGDNWTDTKEEGQPMPPRQAQSNEPVTNTDECKGMEEIGFRSVNTRSIRTPQGQPQAPLQNSQLSVGKRGKEPSGTRQNQQMGERHRYEGGPDTDQPSVVTQWQSPREYARSYGQTHPANNMSYAEEYCKNYNYQTTDQNLARPKTDGRRDFGPSPSRTQKEGGVPPDASNQNDRERLGNMSTLIEGIKQKTEAHRERCRRSPQEDGGFGPTSTLRSMHQPLTYQSPNLGPQVFPAQSPNLGPQVFPAQSQNLSTQQFQEQTQSSTQQQFQPHQQTSGQLPSLALQQLQQMQQQQPRQQTSAQSQNMGPQQVQPQPQPSGQLQNLGPQVFPQQQQTSGQQSSRRALSQRQPAMQKRAAKYYQSPRSQGQTQAQSQSQLQQDAVCCTYQNLDYCDPGPSSKFPPYGNAGPIQKVQINVLGSAPASSQQYTRRSPGQYEQGQGMRYAKSNVSNVRAAGQQGGQAGGQSEDPYNFDDMQDAMDAACFEEEYEEEDDECEDMYIEMCEDNGPYPPHDQDSDYTDTEGKITSRAAQTQQQQAPQPQNQQSQGPTRQGQQLYTLQQCEQLMEARANNAAEISRNMDSRTKQMLSSTPYPGDVFRPPSAGFSTIPMIPEEDSQFMSDYFPLQSVEDPVYYDQSCIPVYGVSQYNSNAQEVSDSPWKEI